jgi:hypothetical protein
MRPNFLATLRAFSWYSLIRGVVWLWSGVIGEFGSFSIRFGIDGCTIEDDVPGSDEEGLEAIEDGEVDELNDPNLSIIFSETTRPNPNPYSSESMK